MNIIDQYISEQDSAAQPYLKEVCAIIRKTLPGTEEKISWGMPTWRDQRNLIHMAPAKKHIGIYPGGDVVAHFAPVLTEMGLRFSKGAIQIPYKEPLPERLIADIAATCLKMRKA